MRTIKSVTLPVLGVMLLSCGVLLSACSGDNVAEHMSQASSYLDSGDFRSATIELKNVLQSQPENDHAWFVLGQVSLAAGQYAEAAHQFRRAQQYGTQDADVHPLLARALIGEGLFKEALEILNPEAAADPGARAHIHALRGRAYLGLQDREHATHAFDAALAAQAHYAPALVGQALVAWRAEEPNKARNLLQDAIDADPSYARAWAVSGNLAFRQKRCDDVITAYDHIRHFDAGSLPPAQTFYARAHTAHCQLKLEQVDKAAANINALVKAAPEHPYGNYLKALLAYQNKDYKQATSSVQKALAAAPNSTPGTILFGMIKAAQGDLEAAQLHFTDAVSQSPDNLKARQLLAAVYIKRGLPEQAVKILREEAGSKDADPRFLAMLGEASLRAGQQADGLKYLKRSALESPDNANLQLAVAHRIGQAGDVNGALELLNGVQPNDSSDTVRANVLRIKLYLRNKRPQKAIAEAQDLVAQHTGDIRFVRLLARVFAAADQSGKARETLKKAIQANPDNVNLRLDLGRLAMAEGNYKAANESFQTALDMDPDNVRAAVAMAKNAARQGHESEATTWLEKAVEFRPDSVKLRATLARVYLAQKRPEDALPLTKALVADAPDNPQIHKLRATTLWTADKRDEAVKGLRTAITQVPDAIELQLGLARMLTIREDFDEAEQQLRKTRQQHPESVRAATMLAQLQLHQGKADAALATAKSLRQSGKQGAAHALTGNLLRMQNKYEGAAEAYAKAYDIHPTRKLVLRLFNMRRLGGSQLPEQSLIAWLKQHPEDTQVTLALAQWYQATGKLDVAAKQYRKLLDNGADNPVALNNLAMIYFSQGDDRAVRLAERAHQQVPKNPAITDTLGWILVSNGDIERGLPLVRQAAKAAPKVADIQYHFAAALVQSGSASARTEARSILTELLATDAPFSTREDAQRLLQQIKN